MSLALHQFLMLYLWFPLAVILVFLLLIARFYEQFSGTRTYFRLFLVPIVLFAVAVVRYAGLEAIAGDAWGDLLLGGSGLLLAALCIRLYLVMMSSPPPAEEE